MTERQRYLHESHLRHVGEVADEIEAAGYELVRLAEWSNGQPHTEFRRPGPPSDYFLIFGHARIELYRRGRKVDGARIANYRRSSFERLLAKAVAE